MDKFMLLGSVLRALEALVSVLLLLVVVAGVCVVYHSAA